MESKNMDSVKGVVRITYKLVKKVKDVYLDKQNDSLQKTCKNIDQTSLQNVKLKEDEEVEDEDDLPLIRVNLRSKTTACDNSDNIAVVQPRKAIKKSNLANSSEQKVAVTKLKKEDELGAKVKPAYCKICFIKTQNEEEALQHEHSHNTFRNANGRWKCIVCSDQFPFYCDLLNHFLNHRDILELYSVYLSNLDMSLVNKHQAESSEEADHLESDFKDDLDYFEYTDGKRQDGSCVDNKEKQIENHPEEEIKTGKEDEIDPNCIVPKIEPNEESDSLHNAFGNFGDSDPTGFFREVDVVKLESGFAVKKELLDNDDDNAFMNDDVFDDGFNDDSDEDKPLSKCIVKKHKKKKKKNDSDFYTKKKSKKRKKNKVYMEHAYDREAAQKSASEEGHIPYSKFHRTQKCKNCDFESSKKAEMENHMAEHVEGEPILCELCDFRCKIERQLYRHKRIVHEGYKYMCDSCEFTSKTLGNMRGHMVVHGDRKIGCNLCGKMFRRKNNLNDHLKTHTNTRPFKCSECPKTFKDPKGYKMHLLGTHNIVQRLTCDYCNFQTDHRHELNIHKAGMHHSKYMRLSSAKNDKGETVDTIIYACNMCEYFAQTEANLKSHLIVHNEKRISCEVCGKLFRRLGNLLEHQRSHSEYRPYACPVCPAKAFKDNKSYRRHIARQHDLLDMIKCHLCDYKTHTQGLMKYHHMKHSGQLRFKCNDCSYSCMTRKTMQRHKLVHKDVLPVFNCDLCDFQSVSDRAVKRHKQIHAEK